MRVRAMLKGIACLILALGTALLGPGGLSPGPAAAAEGAPVLRLGLLQFGTVSWELDVIATHHLAKGVTIEITPLANPEAGKVALMGGSVDAIVSDWLWVSRQRHAGHDIAFAPYSSSVGALLVPADSPVKGLEDLPGTSVGVVGGPLDKNWLILSALALDTKGVSLKDSVDVVSGAPPLLNEQAGSGRLDAILTFWHFAARLQARGFREVISVPEAMEALGMGTDVPAIGYVFDEAWTTAHPDALKAFIAASRDAKAIMAASDAEWERLRPLTRAKSDAELAALRDGFRAGIPVAWGPEQRQAAARLYAFMAEKGGETLVGPGGRLAEGTFLPGLDQPGP